MSEKIDKLFKVIGLMVVHQYETDHKMLAMQTALRQVVDDHDELVQAGTPLNVRNSTVDVCRKLTEAA